MGLILCPTSCFSGPKQGKGEASGNKRQVVVPVIRGPRGWKESLPSAGQSRGGTRLGEGAPWCLGWGPPQAGPGLEGRARVV